MTQNFLYGRHNGPSLIVNMLVLVWGGVHMVELLHTHYSNLHSFYYFLKRPSAVRRRYYRRSDGSDEILRLTEGIYICLHCFNL